MMTYELSISLKRVDSLTYQAISMLAACTMAMYTTLILSTVNFVFFSTIYFTILRVIMYKVPLSSNK